MAQLTEVREELKTIISAAWPELTTIWLSTQLSKKNWLDIARGAVAGAEAPPPWSIVAFGTAEHDPGPPITAQSYRVPCVIGYLCNQDDDSVDDMDAYLAEKVEALRDLLRSTDLETFNYIEAPTLDWAETDPTSTVLVEGLAPLASATVTVTLYIGTIYTAD